MNKITLSLFLLLYSVCTFSQVKKGTTQTIQSASDRFPIFSNCTKLEDSELEDCFYNQVQALIFQTFVVPEKVKQTEYKGEVKVLFEVDDKGVFKLIYVSSQEESLRLEVQNTFSKFPKIQPATYNGIPIYSRFNTTIKIPLIDPEAIQSDAFIDVSTLSTHKPALTELDQIVYKEFKNPEFKSHLNIPFSHSYYAQFDSALNQVGSNNHTGSKPYTYNEVSRYFDLKAENDKLKKKASNWFTRKLWNESVVEIQGEDYWFTLNPILDMQGGNATGNKTVKTFINTRGINFKGGLGSQINFTTTVFESQGKFADYFNRYAQSIRPDGGNPALIPGMGIAKAYKTDAFDFPLAEANLTFTPNQFFDVQLGYSRNFIGDGYRSLLVSDAATPYPYFKMNTKFWKIKYTNTYTWLKDVRPEVALERTYAKKFVANHYLSWNVSNHLNLGFFESVIWSDSNNRGFDMSFANPIIFYRSVEFAASSRSGNALLGMTTKYKWNNQLNLYGQFLLDEFSLGDVQAGQKSWKNKFGYQLGLKYYNAFKIDNLLLQLEFNQVRPYVYSHTDIITNYAHNNQSLAHQWGANFREFILIARYYNGRFFGDFKLISGMRGLDFADSGAKSNYGGNPFRDYEEDRYADSGVTVGQGNKTPVFMTDLQVGYLINPATNLKLFGSFIYRNFQPAQVNSNALKETTTWFSFGIRSDVFNWYFDY